MDVTKGRMKKQLIERGGEGNTLWTNILNISLAAHIMKGT